MTLTQTPADPPRNTRPWWRRAETLAAIAAIACFVNALPNDYCYDDVLIVRDSPKVNAPSQWAAIWTTDHWSESHQATPHRDLLYRPVSLTSYRLVRMIAGPGALPQHAVNVALHALICVLLVRLCRRVDPRETTALLAGLAFAVLPIHADVVTSVVGRADLLATLGVLVALLAHHNSLLRDGPRRLLFKSLAAIAVFATLGSKESGVCVVALVVLFDGLWRREGKSEGRSISWWRWTTLSRLVYLLVPTATYLALRYYALGERWHQQAPLTKTINVLVDAPPVQHALGVFQLFGMYWVKTVWPAVLSIKYSINGIRLATSVLDPHVLIGIAATAALTIASVIAWRHGDRRVGVLSGALVLSYLPTANALVLMQVFFADRIWYLPSVWIALLGALAVGRWLRRPVWWVVVGVIMLAMTVRCWIRSADWRDNGTLYAAAWLDQPDAVGPLHLYGEWLVQHGDFEQGSRLLNDALVIDLGFTDAHRTLGQAHLRDGNLDAARWHLQTADMQIPGHPPTVEALGRIGEALSAQGGDLRRLKQEAAADPDSWRAQIAVVNKLSQLGRTAEAVEWLRQHDDAFIDQAEWQYGFAVTLTMAGRIDEAIVRYERCLKLAPGKIEAAVEVAMLLLERRQGDDLDRAWHWADHASTLAPNTPIVLACRAELSAHRGDVEEAVELYGRAINALPPGSPQRRFFVERAKALGR